MEKTTKIAQDKRQTRATIPKKFVEKFDIKKGDEMKWKIKNKKLRGELKR